MAQAVPAKKRHVPPLKAVLLAAALAVGCVLSIAAGLPMKTYQLLTGGTMQADVEMSGPNRHIYCNLDDAFPEEPLVLENGRLWLVLNKKRIDITDRIDAETPYIIESTNDGLNGSLIVGGTPENFGWCLWQQLPNDGGYSANGKNYNEFHVVLDGITYVCTDDNSEYLNSRFDEWERSEFVYPLWYTNGEKEITLFD